MANAEVPEDLRRIVTRAEEIQQIIQDVFAANGIDLPERQYIAIGAVEETAHDEEQLTISFASLREGVTPTSSSMYTGCAAGYIATYYVELVRCTPQQKTAKRYGTDALAPTSEDMGTYGASRAVDAWLLLRSGQSIREILSTFNEVDFAVDTQKESGGVQAVRLSVDVMV